MEGQARSPQTRLTLDRAAQDVAIAALLVAAKVQDTLKKLREIQIAAWQVQNIIEGGTGIGEGDLTVS